MKSLKDYLHLTTTSLCGSHESVKATRGGKLLQVGRAVVFVVAALVVSLTMSTTASAQTATSSSNDADANGPAKAIDGDLTTRWASGYTNDEWWQVDYGTNPKTFDRIAIEWESASSKDFQILATNDETVAAQTTTTPSDWDVLYTVAGQAQQANHARQILTLGSVVTYRYIRFHATARTTGYGNSFYEFTPYCVGQIVDAPKEVDYYEMKAGATTQLSPIVIDANGYRTNADPTKFDYSVSDATLGSVDGNGVFTAGSGTGTVDIVITPKADSGYNGQFTKSIRVGHTEFVHTRGVVDDQVSGWGVGNVPADKTSNLTEYYTAADDPLIENPGGIRQKTHVTEHYIYAIPGETIYLSPYTDFYNQAAYYETFVRWYDYRTDAAHPWLSMNYSDPYNRIYDWGIVGGTVLGGARQGISVAKLSIPADADITAKPIVIAMDAGQKTATMAKINRTAGAFTEPLINFRHVFYIYDSRAHVHEYSASQEANEKFTRERKRNIVARAGIDFQVRLNYVMPQNKGYASGMLYELEDGTNARIGQAYIKTFKADGTEVSGMFNLGNSTTAFEATSAGKSFFRTLKCSAANAKTGTYTVRLYAKDVDGNNVYVRGSGGTTPLIIQEYEVKFVAPDKASFYNEAELQEHANEITHQQYSYLNSHYGNPVAVINYDQYTLSDANQVSAPASTAKYYKWPVDWEDSNYSFGYKDRNDFNMYVLATHSSVTPYHAGADTWPATSNFPGSAVYNASGTKSGLFDRRFYETKGAEQGYFYYINAASDPGVMARVPIDELCLGSTLYVTGWVAEFSATTEKANLIFNFNAVLKDGSTVTLSSYTTGYVPTAPGGNNATDQIYCGKWYKAYYSFVPNTKNTGLTADQIDHYELALENNCISSGGADYAIDDIRVWVSKPEVRSDQLRPVCTGEDYAEVKVSANFNSLLTTIGHTPALTEAENKALAFYYTFLDKAKYDDYMAAHYGEPEAGIHAFNQSIVRFQYDTTNPSENQGFGKLTFNSYFEKNRWPYEVSYVKNDAMRDIANGTEYLIFNTRPKDKHLFPGKEYIIALWAPALEPLTPAEETEANILQATNFVIDDPCAKICVFRVHSSGVIKVNGEIVNDEDNIRCCENQYPIVQIDAYGMVPKDPTNTAPDAEKEMMIIDDAAVYDWYAGRLTDYYAEGVGEGDARITLDEAIHNFREYYPDNFDLTGVVPRNDHFTNDAHDTRVEFTQEMIDYLRTMITPVGNQRPKVQLFLRSCVLTPGVIAGRKACYATAVPIRRAVYVVDYGTGGVHELGAEQVLICTDPAEVRVFVESTAPHLVHGFSQDVNYPVTLDDVPLRIGLDQILASSVPYATLKDYTPGNTTETTLKSGNNKLNVPIRKVLPTTTVVNQMTRLSRNNDVVVYLVETSDPEYSRLPASENPIVPYPADDADDAMHLPQVGVLLDIVADKTNMANNVFRVTYRDDFRFKEGHYYRCLIYYTEVYPADYTGQKPQCTGQLVYTLKVVPKYQMWTGDVSTDFNNDLNWRRVSSTELHHDFTGADDPARRKLTDGYETSVSSGGFNTARSYVPMDFTDVLIPSTMMYPRMYGVTKVKDVTVFEGEANPYSWPVGGYDAAGENYLRADDALQATATPDIQYDMAAYDSSKGVSCRPWYANTCEHITFLPGAEMYGQQHLNYQRAWVELELDPDRWYTLTSPLKKIVSGDMYLPSDQTATPGRQETEHFLPITYDNSRNDRFRPAVYQRAWDHSGMAKIYRMDDDGMYGDGKIDDAYVAGTWSHVYNDNEEIFTDGRGFSIRTDISRIPDADKPAKVLFRLPKDDESYTYHNSVAPGTQGGEDATGRPTGNGHVEGDVATINRTIGNNAVYAQGIPNQARLNDVSGTITVTTENAGQYFLVGNPFMASLDMQKFFDANPGLQRKFWVVTANRQEVTVMDGADAIATDGTTTVAPMQAFFVEATDAAAKSLQLTYTKDMQKNFPVYTINVDGSNQPGTASPNQPGNVDFDPRPGLQMPARRSGAALDGQLRILLSDPSEPESRSDHSPRLVSTAVVALAPMASADYKADEDAILLLDSNLDTQSALYTVAGETAVSINRLEHVDVVPLGIVCDNDELSKKMLTLSFDGADTFPQPLYLYDAQSHEATPITDDLSLSVPAASAGQYFITTGIDEIADDAVAAGPIYNLKGIRVASTRNEQIVIQGTRKSVVK